MYIEVGSRITNSWRPYDKSGICSVYTELIYADTKKRAIEKAKEKYGKKLGSIELVEKNVILKQLKQ